MPKNVLTRIKDTKVRTLLILGILVAIGIIFILYLTFKPPQPKITEESVTTKVPEISAVPGGTTSERYQQLLEEENRKRAEAARQAGTSAIATIIGAKKKEGSETFGIEGQLLAAQQQCVCVPNNNATPELDPVRAAELIAQLRNNPERAVELLKQNPGLAKAMCKQDQELAYQTLVRDPQAAKIILSECPEMAKLLAEKNPELFKKLMLENPELARQLAEKNPDLFKKLMQADPEFAKQLISTNPDLVKTVMKNDVEFAKQLAATHPDLVKTLMKNDVEFAKQLAATNPDLVKNLMKNDPEFAKKMALANPDLVKKLMVSDPNFAKVMADNNPDMIRELMHNDPRFAKILAHQNPSLAALVPAESLSTAPKVSLNRAQEEARRRAQQEAALLKPLTEQQQKQKQALRTGMDNQVKNILQAWNEYIPQVHVEGEAKKEKEKENAGGNTAGTAGGAANAASGPPLFKAGTILFAVLDTAINSDEPGPVLATIVDGPYRGAKLVGTMTAASQPGGQPPEKVTLNFNQMNLLDRPATLPIQAVAIDPNTARTAVATDVDHHYLMRYGTLLASSLLTGYAKAITSQGTTQTTNAASGSTTTTTPTLSKSQTIYAALGQVGTQLAQGTASWFNTPPTITVDAGTGVGILFLSDVNG